MIVDNFREISKIMKFNNNNEFYFIQIIQRKKDGNQDLHVRNGYRLIRSYYVYSVDDLISLRNRIVELCESNNARAYINPNVRNANEVALECAKRYTDLVADNRSYQGNNIWDSVCGSLKARGYKSLWIVDIDNPSNLDTVRSIILKCRHNKDFNMYVINTVNGYHIVCNGFDTTQFKELLKQQNLDTIDVHKNSPTLLYYNDLSSK